MIKTFNLSAHPYDLSKFNNDISELENFILKHKMDGIELIQNLEWSEDILPARLIKGLHMRFWPMWLDFWKGDKVALNTKFGDEKQWVDFYGSSDRNVLIEYYKKELQLAADIGVKYVVFHVGNVEPEHCFSYDFSYNSDEVISAAIEMINEILDGMDIQFDFLMENLWWPGLNMLEENMLDKLLTGIHYKNKGIMLDIGHLMNTNITLESEAQAVEYILDTLNKLGSRISYIKGIHLNSSLSGEYVKNFIGKAPPFTQTQSFMERYIEAYKHILNIDRHVPFSSSTIINVINKINPDYLVYEVLTDEIETLEKFITLQNKVLGYRIED